MWINLIPFGFLQRTLLFIFKLPLFILFLGISGIFFLIHFVAPERDWWGSPTNRFQKASTKLKMTLSTCLLNWKWPPKNSSPYSGIPVTPEPLKSQLNTPDESTGGNWFYSPRRLSSNGFSSENPHSVRAIIPNNFLSTAGLSYQKLFNVLRSREIQSTVCIGMFFEAWPQFASIPRLQV